MKISLHPRIKAALFLFSLPLEQYGSMLIVLDGHILSEMDCVNNLFSNIDTIREAVGPIPVKLLLVILLIDNNVNCLINDNEFLFSHVQFFFVVL